MNRWLCLSLALLVSGCGGLPVKTDYQPGYDFSLHDSYFWQPATTSGQVASIHNSALVTERVSNAVDEAMARKGIFRIENREDAKLVVSYQIGVEDRLESEPTFYFHSGYSFSRSGFGLGLSSPLFGERNTYQQSVLVIDLLHPQTNQLLWRGSTERRLPVFESPQVHQQFITESVNAILERFPPH